MNSRGSWEQAEKKTISLIVIVPLASIFRISFVIFSCIYKNNIQNYNSTSKGEDDIPLVHLAGLWSKANSSHYLPSIRLPGKCLAYPYSFQCLLHKIPQGTTTKNVGQDRCISLINSPVTSLTSIFNDWALHCIPQLLLNKDE